MLNKVDIFLQKIKYIFNKYKAIILILLIFSIVFFFIEYIQNDEDIINITEYYKEELDINSNEKDEKTNEENEKIAVYITGEIKKPGVYYINQGSRIDDVVKEAGGLKQEANIDQINLAKKVSDGEKIHIYKIGEEVKESVQENTSYENGKVNINTADVSKLQTLTGIGQATANKIINYRNENGNFKSIEELKNVSGIGDSKYNAIKNDICI